MHKQAGSHPCAYETKDYIILKFPVFASPQRGKIPVMIPWWKHSRQFSIPQGRSLILKKLGIWDIEKGARNGNPNPTEVEYEMTNVMKTSFGSR